MPRCNMARRYSAWGYASAFGLSLASCAPNEGDAPVATEDVGTEDVAAEQREPAAHPDGVLPPATITDAEGESQSELLDDTQPGGAAVEGLRGPVIAAFPAASGTCRVSFPVAGGTDSETVSWDELSGRLQTEYEIPGQPTVINYWVLDTRGQPREEGSSVGSSLVRTYDVNGGVTSLGIDVPGSLWSQSNEYDLQGRLVSYVRTYVNGDASGTGTFEYAGALLMRTTRSGTDDDQYWSTHFEYASGRVSAVEHAALGHAYSRHVPSYDEAGRLVRLDIDGAGLSPNIDGIPDIRQSWSYDAEGRLIRFEQDGTELNDAPIVDGVPDEQKNFEAACADIAILPGALYRLPSWSLPEHLDTL
jgi:hypothetical protein